MKHLTLISLCLLTTQGISAMKTAEAEIPKQTKFYQACQKGSWETVSSFLGVPDLINMKETDDNGWNPLHTAIIHGHPQIVKALLDKFGNSDLNDLNDLKDNQGNTPLFLAAIQGNEETIKILLESGANVNLANNVGRTPLVEALSNHLENIAELLLKQGAKSTLADNNGITAWDEARENNLQKSLLLLSASLLNEESFSIISEESPRGDSSLQGSPIFSDTEAQPSSASGDSRHSDREQLEAEESETPLIKTSSSSSQEETEQELLKAYRQEKALEKKRREDKARAIQQEAQAIWQNYKKEGVIGFPSSTEASDTKEEKERSSEKTKEAQEAQALIEATKQRMKEEFLAQAEARKVAREEKYRIMEVERELHKGERRAAALSDAEKKEQIEQSVSEFVHSLTELQKEDNLSETERTEQVLSESLDFLHLIEEGSEPVLSETEQKQLIREINEKEALTQAERASFIEEEKHLPKPPVATSYVAREQVKTTTKVQPVARVIQPAAVQKIQPKVTIEQRKPVYLRGRSEVKKEVLLHAAQPRIAPTHVVADPSVALPSSAAQKLPLTVSVQPRTTHSELPLANQPKNIQKQTQPVKAKGPNYSIYSKDTLINTLLVVGRDPKTSKPAVFLTANPQGGYWSAFPIKQGDEQNQLLAHATKKSIITGRLAGTTLYISRMPSHPLPTNGHETMWLPIDDLSPMAAISRPLSSGKKSLVDPTLQSVIKGYASHIKDAC